MEKEACICLKTEFKDKYWGYWIKCGECGYADNTANATYCGGCGRKIEVIGTFGGPAFED